MVPFSFDKLVIQSKREISKKIFYQFVLRKNCLILLCDGIPFASFAGNMGPFILIHAEFFHVYLLFMFFLFCFMD